MALTPVAVLMFWFNNPVAVLVLLLVGTAAATLRAVEAAGASVASHPVRWLALGRPGITRQALRARFTDAQCGVKAIRRSAARELPPLVEENAWFFDTELLVVAERAGLRIHEVPVDWTDDPESTVDIVRTAIDDLKGVVRLGRTSSEAGRGRLGMQVGIFLMIGIASTLACAGAGHLRRRASLQ